MLSSQFINLVFMSMDLLKSTQDGKPPTGICPSNKMVISHGDWCITASHHHVHWVKWTHRFRPYVHSVIVTEPYYMFLYLISLKKYLQKLLKKICPEILDNYLLLFYITFERIPYKANDRSNWFYIGFVQSDNLQDIHEFHQGFIQYFPVLCQYFPER